MKSVYVVIEWPPMRQVFWFTVALIEYKPDQFQVTYYLLSLISTYHGYLLIPNIFQSNSETEMFCEKTMFKILMISQGLEVFYIRFHLSLLL